MSISDQLKAAIRSSGLSLGEISRGTGIATPVLSRFMSGEESSHRDIRLEKTADKLAEYLKLELTAKAKGRK